MSDDIGVPTGDAGVEPVVEPTEIVAPVVEPVVPAVEPAANETVSISDYVAVTEPIAIPDMKYGDIGVSVEIPVEVANLAGEKGIDVQAVSKELYSSDDFTLSDATLTSLYDAFGKFQVDTYLSSVKAGNESMVADFNGQVATKAENEKVAWDSTLEIMGGEDRWNDLSSYAIDTLDDTEFAEFNAVMENGTLKTQQLYIADMYSKFKAAGEPIAPTILDLEEGQTGGSAGGDDTAMSSADYLAVLTSGEYRKDPEKYDALRKAGMKKGI